MKRLTVLLSAIALMFAFTGTASAAGTFKDGGYSTTSGDSGFCGNDWALDLNVRNFTVQLPAVSPGVYKVVETFANGHFSTMAGPSPESCQAGNNNTVKGGVQGTWHGTYDLTVSGGALDVNSSCELVQADASDSANNQCYTAGWIAGFFGDSATYTLDNWGFTYNASKKLPLHHWVNAQAGSSGDIASTLAA